MPVSHRIDRFRSVNETLNAVDVVQPLSQSCLISACPPASESTTSMMSMMCLAASLEAGVPPMCAIVTKASGTIACNGSHWSNGVSISAFTSASESTAAMLSMMGLAARPVTGVSPMCAIATKASGVIARGRARFNSKSWGHANRARAVGPIR